jgi:hypothetical protein
MTAVGGALAEQSARRRGRTGSAALNESDAALSSIYEQLG